MTDRQYIIPTRPGMGRGLVNHDDRSKRFRAVDLFGEDLPLVSKRWRRGHAYDQGATPHCVAFSGKGILNTSPMSAQTLWRIRSQYSTDEFYDGAQRNDEWDGEAYDGTSALGLCRYLASIDLIGEYRWCFGLQDVLQTLSHLGPVAIGVVWYSDMWDTDENGLIHVSGDAVGGHEVELVGIDVSHKVVIGMNSWGTAWGMNGRFYLDWADLDVLLWNDGDAVTIVD